MRKFLGAVLYEVVNSLRVAGLAPATPTPSTIYRDSLVGGWVETSGAGAWTIDADYNVSSITDNGAGNFTVNWAVPFAHANYAVVCTPFTATAILAARITAKTTTTVQIVLENASGTATDPTVGVCVVAIGPHA